jgi:hypothetical protein
MSFERNCPNCGKFLKYKSGANCLDATRKKQLCKSCTNTFSKTLNLVGQTFGKLTVISLHGKTRFRYNIWLCKCECGGIKTATTNDLRRGDTRSCGCLYHQPKVFNRKRPFEALYNRFLSSAKNSSVQVAITFERFLEYTKIKECFYCGSPIIWAEYNVAAQKNSGYNLDRKDSQDIYREENVVVCCRTCNQAKSDVFTPDEFLVMMLALKEYRKKKNHLQVVA